MNKKLQRFFTIFMVLVILVSSNISVFAINTDMEYTSLENQNLIYSLLYESRVMEDQFPEIREINNNTIKLVEEGYTTEEIVSKISDKDYRTLLSAYKEMDSKSVDRDNSLSEEINEFLIW